MVPDYERTPQLRASDADREEAADRLRIASGEGRIDADELDERLTAVYGARYCSELTRMTSDITPPPPTVVRPVFVAATPVRRLNPYAVGSLVTALLGFGWLSWMFAIPLGHVALHQINRSGGTQAGRRLAILGLIIGYIGLLSLLAFSGTLAGGFNWD